MDPDMEEQERLRELFGYGRAGEPVPQVDPADLKALWALGEEAGKRIRKGPYHQQEYHARPLQTWGKRDGR